MRIGHIELFCQDTERAKLFYLDVLGFELVVEQPGGLIWLKSGETEVLLRPGGPLPAADSYAAAGSAIVLYVPNLTDELPKLVARGLELRGYDGSPDCPTFTDPDGHWFQLADPEGF